MLARGAQGVLLALAAALLFGLVNAVAKGATLHPLWLAAATYLLAGLALAPLLSGARFSRKDAPRAAAMALVGGALAPVALFFGLQETTAVNASLLLTLEMAFTAALARAFLAERVGARGAAGLALLFAAALLVAWAGARGAAGGESTGRGVALVALAALLWGVDNTVSADLAKRHKPHHLVAVKGLLGGAAVALVALALGADRAWTWTDARAVAYIGLLGLGASIVLFYAALGRIGATRASALFVPTVAISGALAGRVLLGEPFGIEHAAAAGLATAGALAVLPPREG